MSRVSSRPACAEGGAVDRNDVELAAEDDATYGRVVEVIDLLDTVGFSGWTHLAGRDRRCHSVA